MTTFADGALWHGYRVVDAGRFNAWFERWGLADQAAVYVLGLCCARALAAKGVARV